MAAYGLLMEYRYNSGRREVVGLVGDNGAGKSTLLKILSGVLEADQCEFLVRGQVVFIRSVSDSNEKGIFTVYQDLALCDNLDVVSNLFLGMETSRPFWRGRGLNKPSMERMADEVFTALGVKIPSLSTEVGRLSGGQRQGVAIARARLARPSTCPPRRTDGRVGRRTDRSSS